MIKAIIFDCFGVLTIESWLPFKRQYFGRDPKLMQAATELMKRSTAGLISYDEFVIGIAELAHLPPGEVRQQIGRNVPNDELFRYITDRLKPHYAIGLLSNAARDILGRLFTSDQVSLFDDVVLSYQVGVTKPDPRIFQLACERLKVTPAEALFVDDIAAYCTAAEREGLAAILYADFSQFKAELEPLLYHG